MRASSPGDLHGLLGIAEEGGTFGLARWIVRERGTALQLDLTGSVSAQFDLSAVHWDLMNADYTFGFPLTLRRGSTAVRLRLYHLSTHLGDEFVRRDSIWIWGDPLPVPDGFRTYHQSYRFESAELLVEREWRDWRAYGGVDHFLYVAPASLDKHMAMTGLELNRPLGGRSRSGKPRGRTSFIAALDLTMMQFRQWQREWSFRSGFDLGRADCPPGGGRRLAVLLDYHSGPAPFGQFVTRTTVRYLGGGFFVTL